MLLYYCNKENIMSEAKEFTITDEFLITDGEQNYLIRQLGYYSNGSPLDRVVQPSKSEFFVNEDIPDSQNEEFN